MLTLTRDHTPDNQVASEDLYTLSLPVVPGSDACSKALLRADEIKNIIISTIIGDGICGSAYHNGPTEYNDNRKADITYYPNDVTKNLTPVIVNSEKGVA
ncbi:hypothetical protein RMATCC62417_10069 [Rhizopus microsporus]|nr:hypothetical protein RMATCC62417_10069 [Rhizopus microsporus]